MSIIIHACSLEQECIEIIQSGRGQAAAAGRATGGSSLQPPERLEFKNRRGVSENPLRPGPLRASFIFPPRVTDGPAPAGRQPAGTPGRLGHTRPQHYCYPIQRRILPETGERSRRLNYQKTQRLRIMLSIYRNSAWLVPTLSYHSSDRI